MEILQAIVLGIVQGVTEFLPVSSSGHLILTEEIMGFVSDTVFMSLCLHLGTLVSVCIVMWESIKRLFRPPYKTLLFLVIATVPSAIFGILFDEVISSIFSNGKILPFTFFATAILLFVSLKIKYSPKSFSLKNSLFMGIGQTFALLPGLSRSGTTIACGLLSKGKREEVAEFSFLMSIPIILGGMLVEIYKLLSKGGELIISVTPVLIGALTACVTGFIVIRKMLDLVKRGNFKPFIIYLSVLSVICSINYYLLPIW